MLRTGADISQILPTKAHGTYKFRCKLVKNEEGPGSQPVTIKLGKNSQTFDVATIRSVDTDFVADGPTKLEIKGELVQTNWPSYNGLSLDPRTGKMFDIPYDSSMDEDTPYNWRHDDVKRIWGSFNTRLNDYVAVSIRGMNAFDRADRFESIPAPWNEGARTWASARSST